MPGSRLWHRGLPGSSLEISAAACTYAAEKPLPVARGSQTAVAALTATSLLRTASLELLSVCSIPRVRHLHYELQDPATRLDNRGNWATARILALGSPWHTCIERTSSRMASPSARWRIAGRSPESGLLDHNRCRGHSARWRRCLRQTRAAPRRGWHTRKSG